MKKIYVDLDTGRKIANNITELDVMQDKPARVGAFLVPSWQNFSNIEAYTNSLRVPMW